MSESVAAVVVTFNRKDLLIECLEALLRQTRPVDRIIIIDNASTDGTEELLQEHNYIHNALISYVKLPENTGGAGGFHEGVKRAYDAGYDWIWLMDDDGLPEIHSLQNLLVHSNIKSIAAICCVVKSKQNNGNLAFTLPILDNKGKPLLFKRKKSIKSFQDLIELSDAGITYQWGSFFNGVLVKSEVIKKAGNVDKRLFIWGDEVDFMFRLMKHGEVFTVLDAVFTHPEQANTKPPLWKIYYGFRNILYINNKYSNYSLLRNLKSIILNFIKFISYREGIMYFVYAIYDAYTENIITRIKP